MRLSLQIEFDKTLDLETHKNTIVVGRSNTCDLIVPHDAISRQHCKIERENGLYFITDLDSSNGVFIDGKRLIPNQRTAYPTSSQLSFGSMECELSDHSPDNDRKIIGPTTISTSHDFTSTIRMARLDLNKPSATLELEKKAKPLGPRNPITAHKEPEVIVERSLRGPIIFILALLALGAAWYFGD